MSYDAQKVTYQEVTIFDRPALFTECRIDRATVPEGVYRYELRHGDEDWGEPVELARGIFANYYGTVLTREPFQLPIDGWIPLESDSLSFQDGGCRTVAEFQEKYPASDKDVIDFYSVNEPALHALYFSRSEEQDKSAGCVGHLRGDFGSGKQFYTTWWPHQHDALNTPDFKADIDRTINWLREQPGSPLRDFDSMKRYCNRYEQICAIKGALLPSCGFMAKTQRYVYDADGRKTAVLNKKETAIAQSKQELIKDAFAEWIWKDPDRREAICKTYNVLFNSNRPREYDGSHISFSGMNPEITLRKHQVNAIAHILYGGNTLLAHVVGAGKTFEMVAAAMESKRLGLCQKSLFVVPNHLTEQWATEFLQLYPAANILVATRKDFETKNRKKFCGRIATGDYDAVIIGHSQFEKIPMSVERQRAILEQQIDEIMMGISEAKREKAENFTIKQMEKTKKGLQAKIDKLNDQSRKDDVVTFEELGVDRIFIDESHYFKNLFLYTKMRNVGGIAQTEAQKSSDLFMKCRYLDEITGGRGIVFATGTPISNSMVELYTIQRYLQMNALQEQGLQHFDAWAANYGETVTAIELSPEGYNLVGR